MMEKESKAGIGDMKFVRGGGSITTYALSSCTETASYDPFIYLGALLHVMLLSQFSYNDISAFKYAGSGIRETIRRLTAFGMVKPRAVIKIVGGARMFEIGGDANFGNIGARNIASVKKVLLGERMHIAAGNTRGSHTRTMKPDLSTGSVTIRTSGRPKRIL